MYSIFIPKRLGPSSFVLVLMWLCDSSASVGGGTQREARKKRGRQAVTEAMREREWQERTKKKAFKF